MPCLILVPTIITAILMMAILMMAILMEDIPMARGWLADSVALMADAGHHLSDVLGLLLAWISPASSFVAIYLWVAKVFGIGGVVQFNFVAGGHRGGIAWEAMTVWTGLGLGF